MLFPSEHRQERHIVSLNGKDP